MKTSELTGAALDWAVAKCEDFNDGCSIIRVWNSRVTKIIPGDYETREVYTSYTPSTDWAQGGPIIERELLMIEPVFWTVEGWHWVAYVLGPNNLAENYEQRGSTPLIAAMRCYVASKLGDDIEIPEDLK